MWLFRILLFEFLFLPCFSSFWFSFAFQRQHFSPLLLFSHFYFVLLTKLLLLLLMTFLFCKEFDEKFSGSCFDEIFSSLGFQWNIQSAAEERTELRSSLERKSSSAFFSLYFYQSTNQPTNQPVELLCFWWGICHPWFSITSSHKTLHLVIMVIKIILILIIIILATNDDSSWSSWLSWSPWL